MVFESKSRKSRHQQNTHLLRIPVALPYVPLILLQALDDLLVRRDLLLARLVREAGVAERAAGLGEHRERLLGPLDVLETQLGRDDLEIAARVDVALDVRHLGVVERAHDLEDAVDGADVGQEVVAEARAGGCTLGNDRAVRRGDAPCR